MMACLGSSLLCIVLLVLRIILTNKVRLGFIPFNLILAFLLMETAAQFIPPAGDAMAWPFTLAVFGLLCCIHYSLTAFVHASRRSGESQEGC